MDVLEQLKALAARELAIDTSKFEPQTPLADLHIDSLAFVDFLFKVEEEFGIRVPDSSVTDMKTVGDLERSISELVAAAPAKS
ncbi:MAG TPA: acyl carrier protein [Burkholderiales bacterium]|jgi:acyl carrier protein|nr:acyl carrier protein [Burkholderiales bacterium]